MMKLFGSLKLSSNISFISTPIAMHLPIHSLNTTPLLDWLAASQDTSATRPKAL